MEKEEGAAFVGHSVDFSGAFLNQRNYQLEKKTEFYKAFPRIEFWKYSFDRYKHDEVIDLLMRIIVHPIPPTILILVMVTLY